MFFKALAVILLCCALSGCGISHRPPAEAIVFTSNLSRYPPAQEKLKLQPVPAGLDLKESLMPFAASPELYIIVHPAYGLFFQNVTKNRYPAANYLLLNRQFQDEARYISEMASSGSTLLLILPGDFETEGLAPSSFISYLNKTAFGPSVFYMTSETSSSGYISQDEMIKLYYFIKGVKAERIMVGGGYIGRCQGEFYRGITSYLDKKLAYIVPELSTISPEDVSEREALNILSDLEKKDYSRVAAFIERRAKEAPNMLSLPLIKEKGGAGTANRLNRNAKRDERPF